MLITTLSLLALAASITHAISYSSTPYRKVEEYSGSAFFAGFDSWNLADPTDGYVNYTDFNTSATSNLTAFIWHEGLNASNPYIGVDYRQLSTNSTSGRKSVRLMSKKVFNIGLLTVIDVVHMPSGPGVWPAVWYNGNVSGVEWPNAGEQDIIEFVNDSPFNAMTLHTAPGCAVDSDTSYQGKLVHADCNTNSGMDGCSIQAPPKITYDGTTLSTAGQSFNYQGGGVYVHEWTEAGSTVWLFPRDNLPQDLANEQPDPSTWTNVMPLAHFSGSGCSFDQSFRQQQLIINICLCGQWAGAQDIWAPLINKTGSPTCEDYVANHPESFKDAYFEFGSIKMYSTNPSPWSTAPPPPAAPAMKKARRDEIYHDPVYDSSASRSNGLSPTSAAPSHRHHGHNLPHTHLHAHHGVAPYRTTNTTKHNDVQPTAMGVNHTTTGLPSPSSTVVSGDATATVEVSRRVLGLFIALLFAAMI